MPRAESERIEIKNGNIVVPIFEFSDGRFCVDTMLGGARKRITPVQQHEVVRLLHLLQRVQKLFSRTFG